MQKRLEQPKQSGIVGPDVDLRRDVSLFVVSPNDVSHIRAIDDVLKFGDENMSDAQTTFIRIFDVFANQPPEQENRVSPSVSQYPQYQNIGWKSIK